MCFWLAPIAIGNRRSTNSSPDSAVLKSTPMMIVVFEDGDIFYTPPWVHAYTQHDEFVYRRHKL